MIFRIVIVRDAVAQGFTPPSFHANDGLAIRSFKDAINDPNSGFFKHPHDYDLFVCGSYDDQTGRLEPCEPMRIALGKELKQDLQ